MPTCEACGNDYDRTITVSVAGGDEHVFDSFECAISRLAPECGHCGVRIVGHGVQAGGRVFCCAHCAREEGHDGTADRA
jgi:hypothetical protein